MAAYNLIVPVFKLEEMVRGGMAVARRAFSNQKIQEDEYLFAIAVENATEVRNCFEILLGLGLTFDDRLGASDDFTVVAKEGIWWPVPWLVNNGESCWFIADVEAPA